MKVVILAGGGGTRLWPISRQDKPKQILSLLGGETLLRQTYNRLRLGWRAADILVATGQQYASDIERQLPDLPRPNILLEPVRRDSAGAIGLAAACLYGRHPKEILVSVHADHWVSDGRKYAATLKAAGRLVAAHSEFMVAVGVRPTYPETGLGYIALDKKVVRGARVAQRFVEKPNLARARNFVRSGRYLWNVGWFAWRVDHLWSLYKRHLPKNWAVLERIAAARDFPRAVKREFAKLDAISIDYGIIEKTTNILALPSDIGWSDIGHWRSVQEMSAKDSDGNAVVGQSLLLDSRNNLFVPAAKKFVAAIGVSNLIFVETDDVILLAHKDRAQAVKQLVAELKKKKDLRKYL